MDPARGSVQSGDVSPFSAALRDTLERVHWSQTTLAKQLGVSQQQVSNWVTRSEPKLAEIARIEAALEPTLLRGWLLRLAGYVEDAETIDDVIDRDPLLVASRDREAVKGLYRELTAR